MRPHGWVGLAGILAAEAALLAGEPVVSRWFTPIVWTGYVLLADAVVFRLTGASYLTTARDEGVRVALVSVAAWWLFEWYNAPRFWRGGADLEGLWWHYHGLEANPYLRRVGYDWAFATIFPALFLTAAVLRSTLFRHARVRPWRPSERVLRGAVALGAVSVALPLLVPSPWLVPLVWTGWVFLLEPLNARRGRPSWLADLGRGDASTLLSLLGSGLVCGLLWEFWNYWATARWTYTVPYPPDVKLFEMPLLGYLGFPPFALECYALYHWARGWLGPPRGGAELGCARPSGADEGHGPRLPARAAGARRGGDDEPGARGGPPGGPRPDHPGPSAERRASLAERTGPPPKTVRVPRPFADARVPLGWLGRCMIALRRGTWRRDDAGSAAGPSTARSSPSRSPSR